MKKSIFTFLLWLCIVNSNGQNIGIGTTNPLTKLHISSGSSGNNTPFSPLVVEGNSSVYINLLTPNFNESGVLFGKANHAASGGIVYNSFSTQNGLQFRTNGNITQMVLDNSGRLGIGLVNPTAPLSFPATLEKKISFYPGSSGDAGIGVSGNRLQIFADHAGADVALGYDAAGTFNERFAVKGNGAIAFNQSTGGILNIPVSAGSGAAATWQPLGNVLKTFSRFTANTIGTWEVYINASVEYKIPSISNLSVSVDVPSRLIVSANIYLDTECPGVGSCDERNDFYFRIAGVASNVISCGGVASFTGTMSNIFFDVEPGNHIIDFYSRKQYGAGLNYHAAGGYVTVLALPR